MKDFKYLQLYDCYGALLTDNQREACELYYMCDLSLTEIAEQKGVSKQGISETLKKSRELLDFYEGKLHHSELLLKYGEKVKSMTTGVIKALENFKAAHPQFSDEIGRIADMVSVGELIFADEEE